MLYVDKADRSIRWEAHIRRKFEDGVWLWVDGPPGGHWHVATDHHAACCTKSSNQWQLTQQAGPSLVVCPIDNHLR